MYYIALLEMMLWSLMWQAFTDPLNKLKVDECRAHDPFILHVTDNFGHKKIIADFGLPKLATALAAMVTTPPPSRLPIADAKLHWRNFWSGNISLLDLMETLNTKSLAMVLPERNQGASLRLLSYWLQRNLLEMGFHGYFTN